jgi:hypothetical protein
MKKTSILIFFFSLVTFISCNKHSSIDDLDISIQEVDDYIHNSFKFASNMIGDPSFKTIMSERKSYTNEELINNLSIDLDAINNLKKHKKILKYIKEENLEFQKIIIERTIVLGYDFAKSSKNSQEIGLETRGCSAGRVGWKVFVMTASMFVGGATGGPIGFIGGTIYAADTLYDMIIECGY